MRRNRLALVIAFVFIDLLGYSFFLLRDEDSHESELVRRKYYENR